MATISISSPSSTTSMSNNNNNTPTISPNGNVLTTSGSRSHLYPPSFYKNTETHSSNSLYSREDYDDDDEFYDALDTPSWTPPVNNSYLLASSPRASSMSLSNSQNGINTNSNKLTSSSSSMNSLVNTSASLPSPSTTQQLQLPKEQPPPPPPSSIPLSTISINAKKDDSTIKVIGNEKYDQSTTTKTLVQSPPNGAGNILPTPQSSSSSTSSSTGNSPPQQPSPLSSSPPKDRLNNSSGINNINNINKDKAKRNSKVFNLIKNKKDELHNLFTGIKDHHQQQQQQQIAPSSNNSTPTQSVTPSSTPPLSSSNGVSILLDQSKSSPSLVSNLSSSDSESVTPPSSIHHQEGSRLKKLIKRMSTLDKDDLIPSPSSSLSGSGENGANTANPNCIINNDNKHERRVSRWLKNLHSNGPSIKKKKELNNGYKMVQSVKAHTGSIWSTSFNPCGSYLATAGADAIARVWEVSKVQPQQQQQPTSQLSEFTSSFSSAASFDDKTNPPSPILKTTPKVVLEGHTGHILDLQWLTNDKLLTSSIDTTVRLWNVETGECLRTFEHNDIVVSLSLGISQQHIFYTGTLDGIIRKWSLVEPEPMDKMEIGEFITTITLSFTPHHLIVGTHLGNVLVLNPADFQLVTKFNVSTTKKGKGPKIVGLSISVSPPGSDNHDHDTLLISTNDSCIRQHSLRDFKRICKYKGMVVENYQIKPTVSPDERNIIIGSEDGYCYVWENFVNSPSFTTDESNHHHHHSSKSKVIIEGCDYFTTLNKTVTTATYLPLACYQLPPTQLQQQNNNGSTGSLSSNNSSSTHESNQSSSTPVSIANNEFRYIIITDTTGHLLVYHYSK